MHCPLLNVSISFKNTWINRDLQERMAANFRVWLQQHINKKGTCNFPVINIFECFVIIYYTNNFFQSKSDKFHLYFKSTFYSSPYTCGRFICNYEKYVFPSRTTQFFLLEDDQTSYLEGALSTSIWLVDSHQIYEKSLTRRQDQILFGRLLKSHQDTSQMPWHYANYKTEEVKWLNMKVLSFS